MKRKKGSAKEKLGKAKIEELGCPSFADLPSHIIAHILLPLPIESVLICKCVCKIWKLVISDSHFAKLLFERAPIRHMIRTHDYKLVSRTLYLLPEISKIECKNHLKLEPRFKLPLRNAKSILDKYESKRPIRAASKLVSEKSRQSPYIACNPNHIKFDVVNSCNGLLCLAGPLLEGFKIPIVICNPVTGEFISLPQGPKTRYNRGRTDVHFGFGFQPKTNEYKVIKMWSRDVRNANKLESSLVLEIHTLGTPTWRHVEVDPKVGKSILRLDFYWTLEFLTCVNGALHWINSIGRQRSILCFNFESERFQSFPSPPHVFRNNQIRGSEPDNISMGELRGFLFLCYTSAFRNGTMWVMKKYGDGESWTKAYSIDTLGKPLGIPDPSYDFCLPVKHPEEGAAMLLYHSSNCVIYYEPEKFGFKVFRLVGSQSEDFEVIPHIPSLVSLKDIVKGDNIEVLNIHSRCAKLKLEEENEVLSLAQEIVDMPSSPSNSVIILD